MLTTTPYHFIPLELTAFYVGLIFDFFLAEAGAVLKKRQRQVNAFLAVAAGSIIFAEQG